MDNSISIYASNKDKIADIVTPNPDPKKQKLLVK